ncbi:MAG: ATPase [Desulfuromonas sp.]|nr:MAG: ATPase [Desulfuromonas sp.]
MTRQISILSGKGGAGKTSVTAALIKMMDAVVAVDADVNASNLPLLLTPERQTNNDYFGMDIASIADVKCTDCGACIAVCRFDAIARNASGRVEIASDCEGCATCAHVCPEQAITLVPRKGGEWYLSSIANGFLVHADLIPGEDNSGKLITKVRNQASAVAKEQQIPYIVIDGPPGTSCQAISSITGADLVLAVVEESLSGLSDYRRLAELVKKFSIPHFVLINKSGFNQEIMQQIEATANEFAGTIIGRIPFDQDIPRALQDLQALSDMDTYRPVIAEALATLLQSLED